MRISDWSSDVCSSDLCSAYAIGTAQAYNAPMFGSRFVHRSMHSVWRTLMCLALFAFMLRAMVPAGFMPDPGALQNGRFGVAFCSADSATAHLALEFGRHGQSGPHHHEGPLGCPFAMLATQALGTSSLHLDVPAPAQIGKAAFREKV